LLRRISHAAGSLDGSVRVWDTATKQMLRILQQPGKLPVHSVLVVMRPPYLLVTGNRAQKAESATRSIAKPARFMPLGHFAKLAGSSSDQGLGGRDCSAGREPRIRDIIGQSGLLDFASAPAPLQVAIEGQDASEAMDGLPCMVRATRAAAAVDPLEAEVRRPVCRVMYHVTRDRPVNLEDWGRQNLSTSPVTTLVA
jgi:hypothetical protein